MQFLWNSCLVGSIKLVFFFERYRANPLLAGQYPNGIRRLVGLNAYGTAVAVHVFFVANFPRLCWNFHDGLFSDRA